MPVIGRLDDQVEAILINPVGQRRKPDEEVLRERTEIPTAVSEEPDGADSTPEKREAESALPVWLL